jgi:hypothetical protein
VAGGLSLAMRVLVVLSLAVAASALVQAVRS